MASAFGHALLGYTIGTWSPLKNKRLLFFSLLIGSTILPDADVIGYFSNVPYDSQWGHRGFTHSISFALLWSMLITYIFFRKNSFKAILLLFCLFFLATISHAVLDGMTNGGRGVAFFWPLDSERYFLPWRPIQVSPIGVSNFFSEWGIRVLWSEFLLIGLPCLSILGLRYLIKINR